MSEKVKEVTNDNFKEEVKNSEEIVLVDFYADWCAPCKILSNTIDELGEEVNDQIKICKADVEENSDIVNELTITSVPSILIFKSGDVVSRSAGLRSKDELKNDLEKACNQLPPP